MGTTKLQAIRYAEYARLRDEGIRQFDAAREIGISNETSYRYERAWKRARHIEIREGNPNLHG